MCIAGLFSELLRRRNEVGSFKTRKGVAMLGGILLKLVMVLIAVVWRADGLVEEFIEFLVKHTKRRGVERD